MRTLVDRRVQKLFNKLSRKERSHIQSIIELFEERKFDLTQVHLKKLTKHIWELRATNIRILFGMSQEIAIIVNIFKKKTNKTPKHEITVAVTRLKDYI